MNLTETPTLNSIYGRLSDQNSAVEVFLKIYKMRRHMVKNLLPGEDNARTQDN